MGRKNDGRSFQEQIVTTLRCYESDGEMRVKKIDPPVRVMGFGAKRKVIFLNNPFPDFGGVWTKEGGTAIYFEAKSTSEPQLRIDQDSGLTTKQVDLLRNWMNAGAVTFVLWEWKNVGVKLIPAGVVAQRRDQARAGEQYKYLAWQEHESWVKQGEGFRLVDFLPALRQQWRMLFLPQPKRYPDPDRHPA